ncbi:MAG: flagellar biosynthesis protein FlgE [Micavibrio aeruginosavorus]|uniref:Flagellar hook protein FlgE n=1 Tax=Micavibrio aeruginosavorus TaxID=349221 RepID=A0A2W5QAP4_9BACT|nr:MAG: flagellar biosynthesis protein FlgE [Micavibrio aeruginosavorus]
MSLFGSLYTGVSGLSAQSQSTAMISNNIANVNTVGFKRSEAAFYSLVTTEGRSTRYSPGTVSVDRIQRVNQQGPIQQSSSSTDTSISGNGFYPVKRDGLNSSLTEYLYTRNGQFSENAQGFLTNTAGFYLYGWPLDQDGNLPSNQGDLTSLVPIDVAFLGGLTRPTTTAELALNLDSTNGGEADALLTNAGTVPPDFSRSITMYDSLGNDQVVTFEYVKTYGPQATANSTINQLSATTNLVSDLGMVAGSQFSIGADGTNFLTLTVTAGTPAAAGEVQTIGDIINAINNAAGGVTAFLGNEGELVIQRDSFVGGTETVDLTNVTGTPLAALGLGTGGSYATPSLAGFSNGTAADIPPFSTGAFPTLQYLPGDPNYNARGWWQVKAIDGNNNTLSTGLINFQPDGTINALPDADGNVDIELTAINWGNGSALQTIEVDIERHSQFAGNFTVLFADQNGAELGLRTGIDIDRDGFVIARFSNGATSKLYKIPLITFSNPNGLQEVSGTAYSETDESGEENLREAGTGGAGYIEPSTLEMSNVDLADEFAKLIISQRAYSANTKVITTVDQMTEDLLRLR